MELLADLPQLIPQVGRLRWQEWAYGATDPTPWIEVTSRESGRETLPVTLVAVDPAGDAVGAVGLDEADDELNQTERRGRSPWVVGTVVRKNNRRSGVGRQLLTAAEGLAANRGHGQLWVATGDEAVDFYRRCGWRDVEMLHLASTGIRTTILTKKSINDRA